MVDPEEYGEYVGTAGLDLYLEIRREEAYRRSLRRLRRRDTEPTEEVDWDDQLLLYTDGITLLLCDPAKVGLTEHPEIRRILAPVNVDSGYVFFSTLQVNKTVIEADVGYTLTEYGISMFSTTDKLVIQNGLFPRRRFI
jgi:hypothetical protein